MLTAYPAMDAVIRLPAMEALMSWKASAYVKEITQNISPHEKLVLFVLADYHNTAHKAAWPSLVELAEQSLVTKAGVCRILARLEQAGFVQRVTGGGKGHRTEYRLPGLDGNSHPGIPLAQPQTVTGEPTNSHPNSHPEAPPYKEVEPVLEPREPKNISTSTNEVGLFGEGIPKSKIKDKNKPKESRHEQFKQVVMEQHVKHSGPECPWGVREGDQLKRLLDRYKVLTVVQFREWINNYWASDAATRMGPPYVYLTNLDRFMGGPLNEHWRLDRDKLKPAWTQGESTVDRMRREEAPRRAEALKRWEEANPGKSALGTPNAK